MATPDLENEKDSKILRTGYQAYLLRCWLEEIGGDPVCKFTLEHLGNKASKQGFASLEEVTAYLRDTLAARKNI